MDAKYTKDGKKVVVLSKLNSEESIVQEIYVNESGQEFPAGENFVVKTLLDEPSETYQDRRSRTLKTTIQQLERDIEDLGRKRKLLKRKSEAGQMINRLTARYKDVDISQFQTLVDFMTGCITHVVVKEFSRFRVVPLDDALEIPDADYFYGLKLLTLFGVSATCDRCDNESPTNLQWRLSQYSDSGATQEVIPFTSYERACEYLSGYFAGVKEVTEQMIKAKEEYGLSHPSDEQVSDYRQREIAKCKQVIEKHEKDADKQRQKLALLQQQT